MSLFSYLIRLINELFNIKHWRVLMLVLCLFLSLSSIGFAAHNKHEAKKKTSKQPARHPLYAISYHEMLPLAEQTITKPVPTLNRMIDNSFKLSETKQTTKEHKIVKFIKHTVSNLTYSAYKLGAGHFDISRGVYIVDCSTYVDRILKATHPTAFSRLTSWSGTANPTTYDYYHYFKEVANGDHNNNWHLIDGVDNLRPGDVIVFRYKKHTKGHIMILMEKPKKHDTNTYSLRVTDSAPVGHSRDTRSRRVSGVGIGTMLLKINSKSARPYAYAWQIGAPWKNNVAFAMARPVELNSIQTAMG